MFLNTDKTEWLPPVHSMLTSYGSLNLLDLSRPEHVPFLVVDWVPEGYPEHVVNEDEPVLGEKSPWPAPIEVDWKHALSTDMTHLLNDYYTEVAYSPSGAGIMLFHSKCCYAVDEIFGPSVQAMSVWLHSIWAHEQVCSSKASKAA